jgi:hypothetical protein
MKYVLLATIFLVFSSPFIVGAQAYNPLQTGDIQQQVTIDVSPQFPKANEIVNITTSAFGTNLNTATISWSINGRVIESGVGVTKFSVNSGNYGETKNVSVSIQPAGQPNITRTTTIAPQEVSIIYEAESYIPPFYKGKGLFNKEGTVKFVAMPNMTSSSGVRLNPTTLTYRWIINDTVQGSLSGYGKNFYIYRGSILGDAVKVEVEVSSADGKTKGRGIILTSPQSSEALFYEKNPLYGILYNKEISSNPFTLQDSEVTLKVEPLFLSSKSSLEYTWAINGGVIPVPAQQDFVTLRNTTGQQGSSLISIIINNSTHLLQKVSASVPINF